MRNSFQLFISIKDSFNDPNKYIFKHHEGYKIDNVIQMKLSKNSFIDLFRDSGVSGENLSERYSSTRLLQRLELFFNKNLYNNSNTLTSDITTLVNNTYSDIDVNPVTLENGCSSGGTIFNYFFKSPITFDGTSYVYPLDSTSLYDDDTSSDHLVVYEMMAREIDNMISRNTYSPSDSLTSSYSLLDNEYTINEQNFWDKLVVGDSIFIEGAFILPGYSEKLDVILQFVYSDFDVYHTENIQTIQSYLSVDGNYDISQYFV